MPTYSRRYHNYMLPVLGVKWTRFSTLAEARKFARWAEQSTRRDRHPCEAIITEQHDAAVAERYEVAVRTW